MSRDTPEVLLPHEANTGAGADFQGTLKQAASYQERKQSSCEYALVCLQSQGNRVTKVFGSSGIS